MLKAAFLDRFAECRKLLILPTVVHANARPEWGVEKKTSISAIHRQILHHGSACIKSIETRCVLVQ